MNMVTRNQPCVKYIVPELSFDEDAPAINVLRAESAKALCGSPPARMPLRVLVSESDFDRLKPDLQYDEKCNSWKDKAYGTIVEVKRW